MQEQQETLYELSIPIIDDKTNYWMIRAKRGFFYDEYKKDSFIAIGWNYLQKSNLSGSMTKGQLNGYKESIAQIYSEKVPATAINKCIKFCIEMKEKDFVVVVDKARVMFAEVGKYYEAGVNRYNVELELETHKKIGQVNNKREERFYCPYNKRRHIRIINEICEKNFSPYLYKVIAVNRHSLSGINEYAAIILNNSFESYYYNDRLIMSFRVNQENDINAIALSDFISGVAKLLSYDNKYDVVVKTALHSPGDIIIEVINNAKDYALIVLVAYMMIFGGRVKDYEFNSIVGIIKDIINRKYNKRLHELEIENRQLENNKLKIENEKSILEYEEIRKRIENEKEALLKATEENAGRVYNAAEELEIKEPRIIDIAELIKSARKE